MFDLAPIFLVLFTILCGFVSVFNVRLRRHLRHSSKLEALLSVAISAQGLHLSSGPFGGFKVLLGMASRGARLRPAPPRCHPPWPGWGRFRWHYANWESRFPPTEVAEQHRKSDWSITKPTPFVPIHNAMVEAPSFSKQLASKNGVLHPTHCQSGRRVLVFGCRPVALAALLVQISGPWSGHLLLGPMDAAVCPEYLRHARVPWGEKGHQRLFQQTKFSIFYPEASD